MKNKCSMFHKESREKSAHSICFDFWVEGMSMWFLGFSEGVCVSNVSIGEKEKGDVIVVIVDLEDLSSS